jgi:hypothetical protein
MSTQAQKPDLKNQKDVVKAFCNLHLSIPLRFFARIAPHKLATVSGVFGVTQEIDTFTGV